MHNLLVLPRGLTRLVLHLHSLPSFFFLLPCFIILTACARATLTPPPPASPTPLILPTLAPTLIPMPLPSAEQPLETPTVGPRTHAVTLALPTGPGTLDPAQATDESALIITRHLYEGLTAFAPGTTRVVPALADAWTTTDAITWTFHLRPDARFSDGTPLTARTVALNFQRWNLRQPIGDYAFWRLIFGGFAGQADANGQPLSHLASATAPDDATLIIALTQPDASLPNTLALPSFAIVKPTALADPFFGSPRTNSAGSGPYILFAWASENIIHLTRNPNYWGTAPLPDELVFKIIPDDTQRLLALQVGEVEGLSHLNPQDYAADGQHHTRVVFDPALTTLYLGFNQAHAPWNNLDCRLAVAYALDRERYLQYFPGDADLAQALQPPATAGYPAAAPTYPYDPALAAQHWQACPAREIPEVITLYVPSLARAYLPNLQLGQAVQADLVNTLHLSVTLASPEWSLYLSDIRAGRADLFLLGWTGVNGDPDAFLCPLLCGFESAFNSDRAGNPLPPDVDLAQTLLAAHATPDPAARAALYEQAHARIFASVPAIPLTHRRTAWAFRDNLIGYTPSPIENLFFNLTTLP